MKTAKFITLGCKVNQYDTQAIRERFVNAGFKAIENGKKADIYVVNTCTVTQSADRKSRHLIHSAHRQNPKAEIVVTGCYVELDTIAIIKIPGVTQIIKNQDKNRILELLNEPNEPNKYNDTGITNFSGHTRAFLKIQDGCNNFCSYCKVPLVRGRLKSKPLNEIMLEASKLAENGFKELVLCGICLGAYGRELPGKVNLVDVIKALENTEGLLRIRLSSIEAGDICDELINKMRQSKKLCRHLHIPLQSGDDEILKKMHRNYCRTDYLNLIKKIKHQIPDIAITTDVLVGFPGEAEINFQNTVGIIKEILPLKVHIFPYSPRPGTAAYNLKEKISQAAIKERISRLKDIAHTCSLAYKKQFLNKNLDVLVEARPKDNPDLWEGHTDNYIKVRIKSKQNLKNKIVSAKLIKINKDCLEACPAAGPAAS